MILGVEGESELAPVEGATERPELAKDGIAAFFAPLPHPLGELLPAELGAASALFSEHFLDDALGRYARVVLSGEDENALSAEAIQAAEGVL